MFVSICIGFIVLLFALKYYEDIIGFIERRRRFVELIEQIPGPPAWPIVGNALSFSLNSKKFSYQMEEIFRKYAYASESGLFRIWIGPFPLVLICRARGAKVILENNTLITKSSEYDIMQRLIGTGLLTSTGEKWLSWRKMLTPAFHFGVLKNFIPIFNSQSREMIKQFDELCRENVTFDLFPYLKRFALDVIAETAMGIKINAQQGQNEEYCSATRTAYELMWLFMRSPWFWFKPFWYASGYGFQLDKSIAIAKDMSTKVIAEKKRKYVKEGEATLQELTAATNTKRLAFLDLLLSMQKENNLSDEDIREEVDTFMLTGHDTISSTMGFMLFAMGHKPEHQEKIFLELDEIFQGSDREITAADIQRMKYLEKCMKECIRLFPTVIIISRIITEDTKICNYTLPAGTSAAISPFAVMRDPEQFDEPEQFNPENFSDENNERRDPFAFIPFSAGPRNCIGQRFALLEQKIALASIFRRFRVISMMSHEDNRPLPELTLKPSRGFMIRLEAR